MNFCDCCGKEIQRNKWFLSSGGWFFCNKDCFEKFRKSTRTRNMLRRVLVPGKYSYIASFLFSLYHKLKQSAYCEVCGEIFAGVKKPIGYYGSNYFRGTKSKMELWKSPQRWCSESCERKHFKRKQILLHWSFESGFPQSTFPLELVDAKLEQLKLKKETQQQERQNYAKNNQHQ